MMASDDGWAVGRTALHWDGTNWSGSYRAAGPFSFSVSMVSSDDVWAVGMGRTTHWDGETWSAVPNPDEYLLAVAMTGPDDGWAVGSYGTILRWQGNLGDEEPTTPPWPRRLLYLPKVDNAAR